MAIHFAEECEFFPVVVQKAEAKASSHTEQVSDQGRWPGTVEDTVVAHWVKNSDTRGLGSAGRGH